MQNKDIHAEFQFKTMGKRGEMLCGQTDALLPLCFDLGRK